MIWITLAWGLAIQWSWTTGMRNSRLTEMTDWWDSNASDEWTFLALSNISNSLQEPRSVRTMDPPRPLQGRIARKLVPPPPPQTDKYPDPPKNTNYTRYPSHQWETPPNTGCSNVFSSDVVLTVLTTSNECAEKTMNMQVKQLQVEHVDIIWMQSLVSNQGLQICPTVFR